MWREGRVGHMRFFLFIILYTTVIEETATCTYTITIQRQVLEVDVRVMFE